MKHLYRFTLPCLAIGLMAMSCKSNQEQPLLLEWGGGDTVFSTDVGVDVMVQSDVLSSEGLNTIEVELPAWSAGEDATTELLEITGSPRKYSLKYEVPVSEKAAVGEHIVKFRLSDWAGNSAVQEVTVNVKGDNVNPELTMTSPENGIELMMDETVMFSALATDDLKMKDVVISCPALGYEQTFLPSFDARKVEVNHEYRAGEQFGEFEFIITATDAQMNSVRQSVTIRIVQFSSKPRIEKLGCNPVCGVSGGTLPLRFRIAANESHPLTSIVFKCAALSIEEIIAPGVWSYEMNLNLSVPAATPGQRDLEYCIVAVNDKSETTEHKGTLNIFDKVYAIGRGTMAKEKQGYAIPMTRSASDPNEFEFVTWINAVGDGVKFLSERSWDAFNWGVNSEGEIVSPESGFIKTEATGYHKFTFNPTTWTCRVEPVTVPDTPETGQLWLYGQFNEWDGSAWQWRDWWYVQFRRHPENPHCFYIDVKTGGEGTNVALWKVGAQSGDGTFYGFNEPDMNVYDGQLWDYHWWENIAAYHKYASYTKVPYYREDGRKDTVMRLVVDTYLGYMSWMSLKEQVDAGWTIYPPMYTPAE